jgi:hypothetical protein
MNTYEEGGQITSCDLSALFFLGGELSTGNQFTQ